MRDFDKKFPGLSPEQIEIKKKIWERERERERMISESLKKKNPFRWDDGDNDTGSWYDFFTDGGDLVSHGVVSDAVLYNAKISFVYPNGSVKTTLTNLNGVFRVPTDFKEGDIISKGGVDMVTGIEYKGEFKIDAEFFFKYRVITPLTHIANHVWLNTPTEKPEQALDLVISKINQFTGINLDARNKDVLFNDDPIKLTLKGESGAKELQAINTIIEIHTDLFGNSEANSEDEVISQKAKAYESISESLLKNIKGETENTITNSKDLLLDENHKSCCLDLVSKAKDLILGSLEYDNTEATSNIQALNLMVKSEWSAKALEMTQDSEITSDSLWEKIENKTQSSLISSVTLPSI